METCITKYVFRRGQTVGVIMAKKFPEFDKVFISGSLCRRKVDTFRKEAALGLAESRVAAMAFDNRPCALPYSLKEEVEYMCNRATRYFKGMEIVTPPLKDMSPKTQQVREIEDNECRGFINLGPI